MLRRTARRRSSSPLRLRAAAPLRKREWRKRRGGRRGSLSMTMLLMTLTVLIRRPSRVLQQQPHRRVQPAAQAATIRAAVAPGWTKMAVAAQAAMMMLMLMGARPALHQSLPASALPALDLH